jgi:hypothetical protein
LAATEEGGAHPSEAGGGGGDGGHGGVPKQVARSRSSRLWEDVPVEELPYRLVRFEQSESDYLIKRYHFHSTPMFLAYCGGKLVFAEPTFAHFACTRNCMEETLKECQKKVVRGDYLPDDFRFDVSNAK